MKSALLGVMVGMLASCKCDPVKSCTVATESVDCGAGNVCVEGLCVIGDAGAGGGGVGGGVAGGAGGGGGSAGGAGGGQVMLGSIRWMSPDGGVTSSMTLPLAVQIQPANFDAGSMIAYSLRPPAGAAVLGSLSRGAGGMYGGASTPMLTDGVWEALVTVGGLDASVRFDVDRTNPVATLVVEPPPIRVVDGGLSEVDPAPGFDIAWRRDEVAELKVLASEPVTLGPANITGAAVTARACTAVCDAGQCTCFSLDVSLVTIPSPGFRGDVSLMLSGVSDRAGNMATASPATLKVTRWKWKKLVASGGAAIQSPGVDTSGNIFVGAQLGTAGVVTGLLPSGTERFSTSAHGALTAPAVVGKFVYAATKDATEGKIRQLDGATGASLNSACGNMAKVYDSPMALADLGALDERIIAVTRNGFVSAARPTAAANNCLETAVTSPTPGRRYTAVATDLFTFLGNNFNATLTRVAWNSGGPAWGASSTNSPTLFTEGLVLFGTTLGGGGGLTTGGVFAMKSDNANFTLPVPATFTRMGGSAEATGPAVVGTAASPIFIYGNGPELARIAYSPGDPGSFATATTAVQQTGNTIATPPVAGGGGIVYAVDTMGTVSAYSTDLQTLHWRIAAGAIGIGGGNVDSALNIDVARMPNGMKDCMKPGTLYVPSTGDGSLYAFIVDSKGIDKDAPWPKFQRDPRNTGNPASSLTEFSCP